MSAGNHVLMSLAVLIETYWNVNEDDLVFLKNSFSVLIETYWNVNPFEPCRSSRFTFVLIETYWNVNTVYLLFLLSQRNRINRNILECKYHG